MDFMFEGFNSGYTGAQPVLLSFELAASHKIQGQLLFAMILGIIVGYVCNVAFPMVRAQLRCDAQSRRASMERQALISSESCSASGQRRP